MFNRLIYKLTHVIIDNIEYVDNLPFVSTFEENYGYFESEISAESFIVKHKEEMCHYNGFYILEAWIKEPTHLDQCATALFERTYDKDGNLICTELTYRFIPNQHDVLAEEFIKFKGRDNIPFKKGDTAMFYDWYNNKISPCKVGEVPFNTEAAKQFENLEYMDDSYLVYPIPIPDQDNHEHIQSCFMFTENQFKKMIDNYEQF